jgi:peptidoglycan/LPS O-acetylase OafA/YrhL
MQPSTPTARHLPRLDSVRGLAALMVAGYHALSAGQTRLGQDTMWAVGFFTDGRLGVVIFFVLSGLVLGHSLRRSGGPSVAHYVQFCLRRIFRIYPAFAVSTFAYLVYYLAVSGHPERQGGFFYYYQWIAFSSTALFENFFFCHQGLNPVTWTLKVEIIAAFLLPFMHYFSAKVGWFGQTLLMTGLLVLAFLPSSHPTRMCL